MTASRVGVPGEQGSKADQVYRWLRREVADGGLRPNDRVNADQISRDLAVSKIPVREAIARLAAERVLQIAPNAGAVVAPLSWHELDDIQQSRLVLEPQIAALSVQRVTPSAIRELKATITETRRWARTQEGDMFSLNRRFHLALVALAGNELLTEMLDLVLQRVSRYRIIARHSPASARATATEHAGIVAALADRDGDRVRDLLTEHLRSEHSVTGEAHEVDPRYFVDDPAGAASVVG